MKTNDEKWNGGSSPSHFACMATSSPTIRPGGLILTERAVSFCRFVAGARVVDVGCGTGATASFLREKHRLRAVGVDVSASLLGDQRGTIPFVQGRAQALPFRDEIIDGIFCECVLSLLAEPGRAIKEFSRTLRSGGFMVLSDLYDRNEACDSLGNDTPGAGCLKGMRHRQATEQAIAQAGLELLLWEDQTSRLKELSAQMVLSGASLCDLRELYGLGCSGNRKDAEVVPVRPGYFLLIAQKN